MARAPAATATVASGRPSRRAQQVLGLVCFATFMSALDSSVVNVAYPTLTVALHATVAAISWVGIAFLLTRATLLTVFGRLSDMVGHKRIYMAGFFVFMLGSALSGLAWSVGSLIVFRCLQAVGAAMLTANSLAIVALEYPRSRMGAAIGMFETAVSVALGVGPVLGGLLIQAVGWRSIFYVNVPVAAAALLLARRILPPMPGASRGEVFDWAGAATFAAGMVAVLVGVDLAPGDGWGSPAVLAPLALGLGCLGVFGAIERRARHPMTDLTLFGNRTFTAANLAKILAYASTFVVSFALPFYLEDLLGYPPAHVGLALLPLPVGMGLGSLLGGPLSDRIGSRVLAPAGLVLAAAGALAFARVQPAAGYGPLLPAMALLEFGAGLFVSPNDSLIMRSAPEARAGQASGILALTRSVGMILGIAFGATVLQAFVGNALGTSALPPASFVHGFHLVFAVTVALCLVGAALSALR
jgi:EmrB/QacA subfamily drug resistance transporter